MGRVLARIIRRMLTNIDSKDDMIGNLLYKCVSGRLVQKTTRIKQWTINRRTIKVHKLSILPHIGAYYPAVLRVSLLSY